MLNQALAVYLTLGIEEVFVFCAKSNVASAGVIKGCGGRLVSERLSDTRGECLQKYSVSTSAQ